MQDFLIVYTAHPIGGDVVNNMLMVERICGQIFAKRPYVHPVAPYLMALRSLSDNDPADRARGIAHNHLYFKRRIIDEIWLYGSRISTGMWQEVHWARQYGIRVVSMTRQTEIELIAGEFKRGDQMQILACGPNAPVVCRFNGFMQRKTGISVHAPGHGLIRLPWGDIITFAPVGAPIDSRPLAC